MAEVEIVAPALAASAEAALGRQAAEKVSAAFTLSIISPRTNRGEGREEINAKRCLTAPASRQMAGH